MQLTRQERQDGRLNDENLERARRVLLDQGYVILEEVLPTAWVERMRDAFATEISNFYAGDDGPQPRRGHGGIQAPISAPFIDPLIIENPFAFQIIGRIFGERFFGCLPYGCNTAFPGSETQNVHRDCGHLVPELEVPLPPVLLVVNIALDDFTLANGTTEIWPGSHHAVGDSPEEIQYLKTDRQRAARYPSARTTMPAGSIVIRDMRTWHRGMANTTASPRTMLSLVYYRQYFVPDNLHAASNGEIEWNALSDRAVSVYRLRKH